jgi:multiple sugar transport system substrate-binding protein
MGSAVAATGRKKMFYKPKNAVCSRVNRRKFRQKGGAGATMLGTGSLAVDLDATIMHSPVQATSSDEAKWRQCDGTKLVFLSCNTPPSFASRENIKAI